MSWMDLNNLTMSWVRRRPAPCHETMATVGRAVLAAAVFFAVAGAMLELRHPGFVSDRLPWSGAAAMGLLAMSVASLSRRRGHRRAFAVPIVVLAVVVAGLSAFVFFESVPRLRLVFAALVGSAMAASVVVLTSMDNK